MSGFQRIAKNGFGDGLNAYAHSMAWFKGHLYVGTMRGNFPLMKARLPISFERCPVECPDDPYELDLRAEIWRYDPEKDLWERVFKAPWVKGSDGKKIPAYISFRGMVVYKGKDGQERLYVSTWSPAKAPGPVILSTEDGIHFRPICEPGLIGLPVTTLRTLTVFKDRLFTTPAGSQGGNTNISGHSIIYESRDPESGIWVPINEYGFGDPNNVTIFELASCGEYLYAGTLNLEGYQIWRTKAEGTPPYKWEKVIEKGAYRGKLNQCAVSMIEFKGALYVGSGIQGGGVDRKNKIGPAAPELIRINSDGSWDLIVGKARSTPQGYKKPLSGYLPGFDNFFNGYFWRMCVHKGWLYLSTFRWAAVLPYVSRKTWPKAFKNIIERLGDKFVLEFFGGCDLYKSFDGENWIPVTTDGFGNPFNMGIRTMISSPYGLFVGTANPFGPKVLPPDGDSYVPNPDGGCEIYLGEKEVLIPAWARYERRS